MEAKFSAPVQTGPGAHHDTYTVDTGSLFREQSGRGVALTTHTPSRAEVKERVELYLCSPSALSWPVLGQALPFIQPLPCSRPHKEVWKYKHSKGSNRIFVTLR